MPPPFGAYIGSYATCKSREQNPDTVLAVPRGSSLPPDGLTVAVATILQHEFTEQLMTQRRLAAMTGLSTTSVGQFLRGAKSPDLTQLGRLCSALGLDVANVVTVAQAQSGA